MAIFVRFKSDGRGKLMDFRWSILGGESKLDWQSFGLSLALVLLLLVTGIAYFRKMETNICGYNFESNRDLDDPIINVIISIDK